MSRIVHTYAVIDQSSIEDLAIDLLSDGGARKLEIGADWTEIAIGVLLSATPQTTFTLAQDGFRLGLTTNKAGDTNGTSPHCLAVGNVTAETMTYSTTGKYFYNTGFGWGTILSRSGSVTRGSTVGANTVLAGETVSGEAKNITPVVGVFTRDSASQISVKVIQAAGSSGNFSPLLSDFVVAMTAGSAVACDSLLGTAAGAAVYTRDLGAVTGIDEATDGDLDSVFIAWPHVTTTLNIFAFMAVKWS